MSEAKQEADGRTSGRGADVRYALHLFAGNPLVVVGATISVGSIILALAAPLLVNPNIWRHTNLDLRLCWNNPVLNWGISGIYDCSGKTFPIGSDSFGRDLLQMIVLAIPLDLQIAFEVVSSAVAIGIVLGGVAAYAGGILDESILRITDVFFAVPSLILAIVLLVILGRTLEVLTLAILIVWWPTYVRLTRSQVIAEKEKPYIESLRAMGLSNVRILFRHIIPNSVYPVLVQATLDIGSVILTISALTFIGFAPNPLTPELGNLANAGITYFFTAPWLIIFPGLTILLISLGFNLLGDGIRDVFDPRLRR
jgi:peptide/nickel transport system permease protein